MIICDKCHLKHAEYKLSTVPASSTNWDFCRDCLVKFNDWVECMTCNKEEGEFVPNPTTTTTTTTPKTDPL